MNIVILTTTSPHHLYIVNEIGKYFSIKHIFFEDRNINFSFNTIHPYLEAQYKHEMDVLLNGKLPDVSRITQTTRFKSLNSKSAISKIKSSEPNIIIVTGTGKLSKSVIDICPNGIINLHGGDPEKYRGLDSLLWSIYHEDFDSLKVTLHRVVEELDAGDIIQQSNILIKKNMHLYELRAENVINCVKLLYSAISFYKKFGHFISYKQTTLGRYYSAMPTDLKELCLTKFSKFTNRL